MHTNYELNLFNILLGSMVYTYFAYPNDTFTQGRPYLSLMLCLIHPHEGLLSPSDLSITCIIVIIHLKIFSYLIKFPLDLFYFRFTHLQVGLGILPH